mmetsp:Transcript_60610/g.69203  ORF Transcript_60610/g.69203 Transcript_60610/m.69203 type:complete len:81 (+) Transcript_60610:138-380(+)
MIWPEDITPTKSHSYEFMALNKFFGRERITNCKVSSQKTKKEGIKEFVHLQCRIENHVKRILLEARISSSYSSKKEEVTR